MSRAGRQRQFKRIDKQGRRQRPEFNRLTVNPEFGRELGDGHRPHQQREVGPPPGDGPGAMRSYIPGEQRRDEPRRPIH